MRRITELQALGAKAKRDDREELAKLLQTQAQEQSKRKAEQTTVYLPIHAQGERNLLIREGTEGKWRLKSESELSKTPKVKGLSYRLSKDPKGDKLAAGLSWGAFVPGSPVEEGNWLRCEIQSDVVAKGEAQPTVCHMAQATLMKNKFAQFIITTNLDGLYRKAGLQAHDEVCFLHGDTFTERCTKCGYDFERNYPVRNKQNHVHDHHIGECSRCGSIVPKEYAGTPTGNQTGAAAKNGFRTCHLVGTTDEAVGTKDTHINFGECLDDMDLNEAWEHCSKADLCIVMGTSMSLRHITHFPFMSKKTVIVNLQQVPDDSNENRKKIALRLFAQCDPVCEGLLRRLKLGLEPVPAWHARDALPPEQLPSWLREDHKKAAIQRWQDKQQALCQCAGYEKKGSCPICNDSGQLLDDACPLCGDGDTTEAAST
jgi:NAD-dependent SIR2 family protein deacetylase